MLKLARPRGRRVPARSAAALLALACALPLASAGGPFAPYVDDLPVTPRWVDAHHNGTMAPVCCGAFLLDGNATDPDDSGLYDTLDVAWRANASTTNHTLYPQLFYFLPEGPAPPERVHVFTSANLTAFDSTVKDTFNDARFDANVTLRTERFGNASARVALHCFDAGPQPGPEQCALAPPAVFADAPTLPSP